MRLIFHGLALGLLAILLSGCAGTRQYVPLPEHSKSVEDPSKGRLYVLRPALLAAAVTMNVSDSGKPIGRTGPRGYLCWERPPGEAVISGESEGVSALPVNVEAGQRYFFFQHVRMGMWLARNELELIDEAMAQNLLKHCHPAVVDLKTAPPRPWQPVDTGKK